MEQQGSRRWEPWRALFLLLVLGGIGQAAVEAALPPADATYTLLPTPSAAALPTATPRPSPTHPPCAHCGDEATPTHSHSWVTPTSRPTPTDPPLRQPYFLQPAGLASLSAGLLLLLGAALFLVVRWLRRKASTGR